MLRSVASRLWLATLLLAAQLVVPAWSEPEPIVVVLSWDGMRHDYPDRGDFPALARIASDGVRASRLTPVLPSGTFPGHVSMATGTYPDRHGIVDNVFIDRERGRYSYSADADWIDAEPVWIAAERQGVKAATYFWVGSETDWRGNGTSYRMAPFDRDRPESAKVDQMLEWLSLPEPERPRLIMSYWRGADSIGHDEGPNSPAVAAAIHAQDAQLGRLLAGIDERKLWSRTTLIVVSDHGMAVSTHFVDLEDAFEAAGIDARVLGSAVAQIHLAADADPVAAERVLERVLADVPGGRFYRGAALPASYRLQHETRTGDLVATLEPPYRFAGLSAVEGLLATVARWFGKEWGTHGYDPALRDMGGIFLAMGRGVPRHQPLGEVHQIDVAATVAQLLGIDPPRHSEGRSIW